MRIRIPLDDDLLAEARALSGIADNSTLVNQALNPSSNAKAREGSHESAAYHRTSKFLPVS